MNIQSCKLCDIATGFQSPLKEPPAFSGLGGKVLTHTAREEVLAETLPGCAPLRTIWNKAEVEVQPESEEVNQCQLATMK